jgi:hypothetical protein
VESRISLRKRTMYSREFLAFGRNSLFLRSGSGKQQEQFRSINGQSHE